MSDPVRVIAGCTHRAGLLPMYEQQLGAAGIPLKLEISDALNYPGGLRMLGEYVNQLRRWLDQHGDCDNLIFTDAWDVLFYGAAEEVASKVPEEGVLLGAEKNCFPDAYLAPHFKGETAWKFVNAGLLAAKPNELSKWLDEIESSESYLEPMIDQQWLNHRRLQLEVAIDSTTELFYCRFQEAGEMQFKGGKPYNSVCWTWPNFIHFNGKSPVETFLLMQHLGK